MDGREQRELLAEIIFNLGLCLARVNRKKQYLIAVFNYIFLMISDVQHIFTYLLPFVPVKMAFIIKKQKINVDGDVEKEEPLCIVAGM